MGMKFHLRTEETTRSKLLENMVQVQDSRRMEELSTTRSIFRDILDILAQYNRPKTTSTCTSSLGFSRLYILLLWFIVT